MTSLLTECQSWDFVVSEAHVLAILPRCLNLLVASWRIMLIGADGAINQFLSNSQNLDPRKKYILYWFWEAPAAYGHTVLRTHTRMRVCHEHTDISETEVSWNNALVSICNALDFLFTSVYFINMLVKLSWIDLTSHQWAAALSLKIMCIPGFLNIITPNLFSPSLPVYRGM